MRSEILPGYGPLPGTNKNNKLAFISILFLEVFAASPKGLIRGER